MFIASVLSAIFVILWPMPMYETSYVFSMPFFTFWVTLTFLSAVGAALIITIMPLIGGRKTTKLVLTTMILGRELYDSLEGVAVGSPASEEATDTRGEEKAASADE